MIPHTPKQKLLLVTHIQAAPLNERECRNQTSQSKF